MQARASWKRPATTAQYNFGEELLELPIIDAFGRPLKIEQIWLPKLTINNNFRDVARFDRCTTCHQAIDKPRPARPSSRLIAAARRLVTVDAGHAGREPRREPASAEAGSRRRSRASEHQLRRSLRPEAWPIAGLLDADDVTIERRAAAKRPAAKAGF